MFGWFRPRPPLETFEQAWIERHMRWLVTQFGMDRIRGSEVLLPSDETLPDRPPTNDAEVREWMDCIAGRLDLDASTMQLEVVDEAAMPGAQGQYVQDERLIRINADVLGEPPQLVAVLAHELAHELLLGQGRLNDANPDHEWITDLLPVCFGLGIFSGNCTISDQTRRFGTHEFWSIERSGYLPSRMFGYALALFADLREEFEPRWMGLLRPDAREPMRDGLKFLAKAGAPGCLLKRDWSSLSDSDVMTDLESDSPSRQLDAVWEIEARAVQTREVLSAMQRLFDTEDSAVAEHAIYVAKNWPEIPEAVRDEISMLTEHRDNRRRIAALNAAAQHEFPVERLLSNLQDLLAGELGREELLSVLHTLVHLGESAEPLLPYVAKVWKSSLVRMDEDELAEAAAIVFVNCAKDPEAMLQTAMPDPELRERAAQVLVELIPEITPDTADRHGQRDD